MIALPCLLYSMDLTVLNLAVPHLSAELRPSSSQLLWIVDIYGFLVAGSLITMGTLGDRIGRRRLLLIGAAAFGTASVLAAFSTSAEMLIAARALLGVASATLAPSTLSLIRNMFHDPKQRTVAIGVWIASFSAAGRSVLWSAGLLEYSGGARCSCERAGHAPLARARPAAVAGVSRSQRGPARSSQRGPVPGRGACGDLRHQAGGGGRASGWLSALAIVAGLVLAALFVRRQQRLDDR